MYENYEGEIAKICESENRDAYWKHKEIKSYFKLVQKCQNRAIPAESRKRLYQILCEVIHTTLPSQIKVFELIPNKIYSVKNGEINNTWTMCNVDEYMQELTNIMHPNLKNKGKNKAMLFEDDLLENFKSEEVNKLRAYAKLLKTANGTYIPSEKREYLYQTLGEVIIENCPENVKEFSLNEKFSVSRDVQDGDSWCLENFKEYIKEFETY